MFCMAMHIPCHRSCLCNNIIMLFNSLPFLIFLPIVFAGYWMLNRNLRVQNLFVVVASYVFYGWWDWRFLLLMTFTSIWSWGSGIALENHRDSKLTCKWIVTIALIVNLGILGIFKYFNFFLESFYSAFNLFANHPASFQPLNIILPVGISFYTFQALSFVIDVYRGNIKPTKDIVAFLAFVSFFPQLVAGPIERATNLLPQFLKPRHFDYNHAVRGSTLICYGLFKKMVVADVISRYVDKVYLNPGFYSSVTLIIAAIFFSIQIYCDFSGYSDIARGTARLFGIELMLNFDRPYLSHSFGEFWRRWHISLSTWFKDYVYIPLGGNRVGLAKSIRNIWIVFLLSGLWHGAAWGFVIWGAFYCMVLTYERIKKQYFPFETPKWLSLITLNIGVIFAWIFFRAKTVSASYDYFHRLFTGGLDTSLMSLCGGWGPVWFATMLFSILLLGLSYLCPRDCAFKTNRAHFLFSAACLGSIVFLGSSGEASFIYFQF